MDRDRVTNRAGPCADAEPASGNLPRSSDERLDEVAHLLALGILRLQARKNGKNPNNPNQLREFGLDFAPGTSVCGIEPGNDREDQ